VNRVVEGYSTFRRCGIDVLVAGTERIQKRTWADTAADAAEEIEA
jgi:carbamoyltransferase